MSKFIDVNTFEIVDDVFEVDDDIAETISILNKKGYRTTYCCSGHVDPEINSFIYIPKEHYEKIKDMINGCVIFGEQVRNGRECYVAFSGFDFPELYISFAQEYDFPSIPEGFYFDGDRISKDFPLVIEPFDVTTDDGIVSKMIPGKLVSEEEAETQVKNANLELLEWAKSLDYINTNDNSRRILK